MLSEIPYGTFANYSPKGTSDLSKKSRSVCGAIKAGQENIIRSAFVHLRKPSAACLQPFINPDVTLVPVPRSAPLTEGALWPGRVIADLLVSGGFGREVLPCIQRLRAVPKSSSSAGNERASVQAHYESLGIKNQLLRPQKITLVDDVLTQGRTTYACAQHLHEAFPEAEIRIFSMIRTQGFIPDIEHLVDPSVGIVKYYPSSGKTFRDP